MAVPSSPVSEGRCLAAGSGSGGGAFATAASCRGDAGNDGGQTDPEDGPQSEERCLMRAGGLACGQRNAGRCNVFSQRGGNQRGRDNEGGQDFRKLHGQNDLKVA